jgi:hypothetical protein
LRVIGIAIHAGQGQDRGDDAGVPVADEFPRASDSDDEQRDQEVAEQFRGAAVARVVQELNARFELERERREQDGDEPELLRPVAPRQAAGEHGPRPRKGEDDSADGHHGGRVPDVVPRHEAEQRDRDRVGERQDGGGGADLLDDDRAVIGTTAARDGYGDEQQPNKSGGAAGDRWEQRLVGPV